MTSEGDGIAARMRSTTNPKVLAVHAANPDPAVRSAVAYNKACSTQTLNRLAADADAGVLAAVAAHTNAGVAALATIVNNPAVSDNTAQWATDRVLREHRRTRARHIAAFPAHLVTGSHRKLLRSGELFVSEASAALGELADGLVDGFTGSVAELESACAAVLSHQS